jgi:hypothetical protein
MKVQNLEKLIRSFGFAAGVALGAVSPSLAQGWTAETVDSPGLTGFYTSLALDSAGTPHIAYYEQFHSLRHAWKVGGVWNTETVHMAAAPGVGQYCSLAFDGAGVPHISYYDSRTFDLRHAWQAGAVWMSEAVDTVGIVGLWTSIAYDPSDDTLNISYYDADPNRKDLKVAMRTSAAAGAWARQTVDWVGDVGSYSSIAIDPDGDVHISYYDTTNRDLKHAEQVAGVWTLNTIDAVGAEVENTGKYSGIAFDVDGEPHISYYDLTLANKNLKHAWRAGGAWSREIVDAVGTVGEYSSIALDTGGVLHISYYDTTNGDLKHAWLDGGGWSTEAVDSFYNLGKHTSIRLGPGAKMMISYYNHSQTSLRFAQEN